MIFTFVAIVAALISYAKEEHESAEVVLNMKFADVFKMKMAQTFLKCQLKTMIQIQDVE